MPSARVITFFGNSLRLFGELGHCKQVVVDQRVIAGHLLDLTCSHAVRAAVADVTDVHLFLARAEQAADHRGAHTVELTRTSAAIDDLAIGNADARQQPVLLFGQPGVEVKGPGEIVRGRRAKEVDDGFGRELARHIAGAVATHAICDDVQRVVFEDGKAILVMVALQTHVGDACCYGTHG